jgi:hypothetical protein
MHNVQIGSAIALTALLFVVGFGGFSAWKALSPFRLASLDVANLRAEAEAVSDIQVRLDGVAYAELLPSHITSTTMRATQKKRTEPVSSPITNGTTTTPETLSIDDAIDLLLE